MSDNKVINKQDNEIQTNNSQMLPDTLDSKEWQVFLLSGFINEYSIAQVDANIESYKNRIKEIEEKKYEKTMFIEKIAISFSTLLNTTVALIVPTIVVFLIGVVLALFFEKSFIANAYGNIFFFLIKYLSLPLRFIFRIQPNVAFLDLSTPYMLLSILFALIQIGIIMAVFVFVTSIQMDNDVDKQEQQKKNDIDKINKELNDYLPVAKEIKDTCNSNLNEIYAYNKIPEMYHNYESLGMLYGYFACGAALNFQDAAKEYLKDKRTQVIVYVMSQTNELLSMIAQGIDVFNMNQEETNAKLNKLIEQNDRSILGKLFPNNPISNIYSKAKNIVSKIITK